jgi:uncharacterized protein YjiS (DUF1127 family)
MNVSNGNNRPVQQGVDFITWSGDLDYQQVERMEQMASRLRSQAFSSAWQGLRNLVSRAFKAWRAYRCERRALLQLGALDRHMMKDLGINEGDLERLRRGSITTSQLNDERVQRQEWRDAINRYPRLRLLKRHAASRGESTDQGDASLKKCG